MSGKIGFEPKPVQSTRKRQLVVEPSPASTVQRLVRSSKVADSTRALKRMSLLRSSFRSTCAK